MRINLERFTAKELAALLALFCVCVVVLLIVIAAIIYRPNPTEVNAVYNIVTGLLGLVGGLLAGAKIAEIKSKPPNDKTPPSAPEREAK